MSQSGTIAATLLAGFVLYLAARDRLKVYAGVLWGDTAAPLPKAPEKSGGGGGIVGDIVDGAKTAATVAAFL